MGSSSVNRFCRPRSPIVVQPPLSGSRTSTVMPSGQNPTSRPGSERTIEGSGPTMISTSSAARPTASSGSEMPKVADPSPTVTMPGPFSAAAPVVSGSPCPSGGEGSSPRHRRRWGERQAPRLRRRGACGDAVHGDGHRALRDAPADDIWPTPAGHAEVDAAEPVRPDERVDDLTAQRDPALIVRTAVQPPNP